MYQWLRPLLFALNPEFAHHVSLAALNYLPASFFPEPEGKAIDLMGMRFAHPIGLAAGLDKNAAYLDGLAKLGFSFIEVGTTTPRAQAGNPKPRLFRLPEAQALINRMGFNNDGVDVLVNNVKASSYQGILGINIGKNKDTPLNQALDDYIYCLDKVHAYASYITVNISSPNTPGLRALQQETYLKDLLHKLYARSLHLSDRDQKQVPLLLKISPDESDEHLKLMARTLLESGFKGMIVSNTSAEHQAVSTLKHGDEAGGLSGAVIAERANHALRIVHSEVGDGLVLIGSGGIDSAEILKQKQEAGAQLFQLYTGLIYKGPGLVKRLADTSVDL